MAGWALRDQTSPQRTLVGTLTNVHISGGTFGDGDTNLEVTPTPGDPLLTNRLGTVNADGQIECEVNIPSDRRDEHQRWVNSLVGGTVTAVGVWVDDTGHNDKTELHPMDVIYANVDSSLLPNDEWIGTLAQQRGLAVGSSLLAFRFAASSDDREGVVLEGPPLADTTRSVRFTLPFPAVSASDSSIPMTQQRLAIQQNATIDTAIRVSGSQRVLEVNVICRSHNDGGPGELRGEAVTFWSAPALPQISVQPTALSFGLVDNGTFQQRTFRIENVGQADLIVTIPGADFGNPFSWDTLDGTTIPAAVTQDVTVTFEPNNADGGRESGAVNVLSNGGNQVVTLTGSIRAGPPL